MSYANSRIPQSAQQGVHEALIERVRKHLAEPFRKPFADYNRAALLAIVGILVGLRVPRFYVRTMAKRRMQAFDGQLSDTLNLWVNELRSGYSVLQSMEAIAN